jgi:hypothetical protein
LTSSAQVQKATGGIQKKKIMKLKTILIPLVSAFAVSTQAQSVIYNSGAPDHLSGNEMTGWIEASSFTLGSTATFQQVTFWDIEQSPGYQGSITWQIYSQGIGQPGGVLFSGNASPNHTATGNIIVGGATEYNNVFSVGSITLNAGTYWLGLHNGPLTTTNFDYMYWETTSPSSSLGYEQSTPFGSGNWSYNGNSYAFELTNVPEPTTLALAGVGIASLLALRRRTGRK